MAIDAENLPELMSRFEFSNHFTLLYCFSYKFEIVRSVNNGKKFMIDSFIIKSDNNNRIVFNHLYLRIVKSGARKSEVGFMIRSAKYSFKFTIIVT